MIITNFYLTVLLVSVFTVPFTKLFFKGIAGLTTLVVVG